VLRARLVVFVVAVEKQPKFSLSCKRRTPGQILSFAFYSAGISPAAVIEISDDGCLGVHAEPHARIRVLSTLVFVLVVDAAADS
jgi:hypothetical protein